MGKGSLVLGTLAAAMLVFGPVQIAKAGVSCHKIDATGVGQDLGGGTTTAQIKDGGLLLGTTTGSFVPVDFSAYPPIIGIAGTVTFTTNKGTLTVSAAGPFNVVTGEFAASGTVSGATGKLAGATGSLLFAGIENLSTGTFTETITGSICADLSK